MNLQTNIKTDNAQTKLWQTAALYLLVYLMSIGLAFGQTTDERKLELIVQTGHPDFVYSVAFSPDGNILASGGSDGNIKLWSVETGQELRTIRGHTSNVIALAFSPDRKTLASGSWDKTVRLWDIESGKNVWTFKVYSGLSSIFLIKTVLNYLQKV